ncbi:MAG: chorismate mutase [Alphaproteobacteria bacterium]
MDENKIQEILKDFRKEIDNLDDEIVALLAKRLQVIDNVARVKLENNIDPHLQDRIDEVVNRNADLAKNLGADFELIKSLYVQIVDNAIARETKYIKDNSK